MGQTVSVAFPVDVATNEHHSSCQYADVESLVLYLLAGSDPAKQLALGIMPSLALRSDCLDFAFRSKRMRRDMLIFIISANRKELEIQLHEHATRLDERSRGKLLRFGQHNLLHRLALVMILRECYAIRDCSLLLKTTDSIVRSVYEEAIHLL